MRLIAKIAIASAGVVLASLQGSSQGNSDPNDNSPPPAIAGEVSEADAAFTYASDVESGTNPSINHWVCNRDDKDLVFVWEKARLSRGSFNPLPPNTCQENPHFVARIEDQPDFEAPILYTQAKTSRSAAIYKETDAEGSQELQSTFKTDFKDRNGQLKQLIVEIKYQQLPDSSLTLNVWASPPDLTIGLGGSGWMLSPDLVNVEDFTALAKMLEITLENREPSNVFNEADAAWLSQGLRNTSILLVKGKGLEKGNVVMPVPLKSAVQFQIKPATLYVFDGNGNLIGTGAYSQIVPE